MTDWMWVYDNPKEAAAEIDRLLARVESLEAAQATGRTNYVPRTTPAPAGLPPPKPKK